jgi:hypothetical protein
MQPPNQICGIFFHREGHRELATPSMDCLTHHASRGFVWNDDDDSLFLETREERKAGTGRSVEFDFAQGNID